MLSFESSDFTKLCCASSPSQLAARYRQPMKPVQAGNLQFHVACVANDIKARKGYQTLFGLQARSDKHSRERFRFFRHIYIYIYDK